jgi:hypothetical protein
MLVLVCVCFCVHFESACEWVEKETIEQITLKGIELFMVPGS